MKRMILLVSIALLALPCLAYTVISVRPKPIVKPNYSNRIVLIRHAEKGFADDIANRVANVDPERRHKGQLPEPKARYSERSFWRLRGEPLGNESLFGKQSEFNFGLIFAAPRDEDNKTDERTYATVAPLAQDLGLEIDVTCANANARCIASHIEQFVQSSDADILISWKHFDLNKIATALGAPNARSIYPGDRNDVIWIMQSGEIVEKRSMHCPGLDDGRVDVGDPDLEVERPVSSATKWISGLFDLLLALASCIA